MKPGTVRGRGRGRVRGKVRVRVRVRVMVMVRATVREEPVHRFALISRPIKTHVMLKLLLSTNQIFRQEKQRKTLTLFNYLIPFR